MTCKRCEFDPWVGKIPWKRAWQPTPVFLENPMNRVGRIEGGLESIGSQKVKHNWSDLACMCALEKEMATHSSILAWEIPGTEEPDGLPSMGSHGVGHDWGDLSLSINVITEFCQENIPVIANTFFQKHKRQLYTWTTPMVNTKIRLSVFSAVKDGESLNGEQKQDLGLTVTQIISSLL